ncbi:MAG: hypothetical protein MK209_08180 [Planctomycetes bacterium]|nr:hypothetical protein [Planctomycetota bacterium]
MARSPFGLPLPVLCALLLLSTAAPGAQRKKKEEPRPLSEMGILNQDPQPIGDPALGKFAERFPDQEWLYLETAHFRIASSIEKMKLSGKDKKRLAPDLEALAPYFPSLGMKPSALPPEVYLALTGMRLEKLYASFQKIAQVNDADFPESRAAQKGQGAYMGDGPYLGEREKYEVVLHADRLDHMEFTEWQRGIRANDTVRWHNRTPSKLIVSMPCVDGDLRQDRWLWPHLAHNMAHMLFDGYKFFAYDPPLWLSEGLALWFEKHIEPESFTRDGGEGVFFEPDRSKDWSEDARKLVKKKDHTSIAKLLAARGPADLDRTANVTAWSITVFLIEKHPDKYAQLIGAVKAQLDDQGYPTGSKLPALQREQMRKLWGWSPMQLEEAWVAWVSGKDEEELE